MKKQAQKNKPDKQKDSADLKTKLAVGLFIAIIIIAVIVFGIIFLYRQIFSENPRFNVTKVLVSSNGYWNNRTADIIGITQLKLNSDNIWQLSLNKLREKTLVIPGVENCDVVRIIPDTIEFIIQERIPRAQIAEHRNCLVDSETFAIPKAKAMPITGHLPLIMGVAKNINIQSNQKIPELKFAMFLIMKTIRDFSEFEIIAIDVENPDYYTLYLRYNGGKTKKVIIPVDEKNADIKFIALRTAMSQAEINRVEYTIFDLSFKDRVVCK